VIQRIVIHSLPGRPVHFANVKESVQLENIVTPLIGTRETKSANNLCVLSKLAWKRNKFLAMTFLHGLLQKRGKFAKIRILLHFSGTSEHGALV